MLAWKPGRSGRLLFRVLFCDEEDAIAAWIAWKGREGLTSRPLDETSLSLFPLVAARLESLKFSDSDTGILAGLRKRAWYQGRMLLRTAERVTSSLEAEGIEAVLLGKAALLLSCPHGAVFAGAGEIEMTACGCEDRAAHVLRDQKWLERPPERRKAAWFEGGDRLFIDSESGRVLLLRKSPFPRAGLSLPEKASIRKVPMGACRVPDMTSMLYSAILRCADWRPQPPLSALAEAACISGQGEADWGLVSEWAASEGTGEILRLACAFFEKETGKPLNCAPPAASKASSREKPPLALMGSRTFCLSPLPEWFRYRDECARGGTAPNLPAFFDCLSRKWGARSKAGAALLFIGACLMAPLRSQASGVLRSLRASGWTNL